MIQSQNVNPYGSDSTLSHDDHEVVKCPSITRDRLNQRCRNQDHSSRKMEESGKGVSALTNLALTQYIICIIFNNFVNYLSLTPLLLSGVMCRLRSAVIDYCSQKEISIN